MTIVELTQLKRFIAKHEFDIMYHMDDFNLLEPLLRMINSDGGRSDIKGIEEDSQDRVPKEG